MTAITITNLSKTYNNDVKALQGINLQVKEGDFFGLLGPNGAGKTTTIGVITSLVKKTSGMVKVFDYDIDVDLALAKSCIGVVPQEFNFNIFEKVIDIVVTQAGYYGIPRKIALERAKKYLTKLGLWEKRNTPSQTLSGGMKRRLMIARALVHEPKILILDEPTAGVDIELRRGMWQFLQEINNAGITIVLTTHYLEEAESLCRNIAIINHGKIIEYTTKKQLLRKLKFETVILDLNSPAASLPGNGNFQFNKVDDYTLEVSFAPDKSLNQLFAELTKEGIDVGSMRNKTNRLEEVFINLVQQRV